MCYLLLYIYINYGINICLFIMVDIIIVFVFLPYSHTIHSYNLYFTTIIIPNVPSHIIYNKYFYFMLFILLYIFIMGGGQAKPRTITQIIT